MRSRVVFVIGMVICALAIRQAHAQPADALKKAQAAFDKAQLDYLQGKYDDAAQGFIDAFAARPFPQFLYNVGASYHMKGKKTSDAAAYGKAVEFYKKYLAADPDTADRLMREMERAFEDGNLTPLPYRVFEAEDVPSAFRLMQSAGHVGKILLSASRSG